MHDNSHKAYYVHFSKFLFTREGHAIWIATRWGGTTRLLILLGTRRKPQENRFNWMVEQVRRRLDQKLFLEALFYNFLPICPRTYTAFRPTQLLRLRELLEGPPVKELALGYGLIDKSRKTGTVGVDVARKILQRSGTSPGTVSKSVRINLVNHARDGDLRRDKTASGQGALLPMSLQFWVNTGQNGQRAPLIPAKIRARPPGAQACITGCWIVLPSKNLEPTKFVILRILDLVDQNLSKFDDFGVVGKLTTRSIQIDD